MSAPIIDLSALQNLGKALESSFRGLVAPDPGTPPAPNPPAAPKFSLPGDKPKGLLVQGNIDLNSRPIVQNADGSHSTEYSTSFEDDHGREVLVPTVVNGRFLTPDGKMPAPGSQAEKEMLGYKDEKGVYHKGLAQKNYEATGQHMGIFDNAASADVYADKVHGRNPAPVKKFNHPWGVVPTPTPPWGQTPAQQAAPKKAAGGNTP